MPRITVYHLTPARRLPSIEETGLRTRADLSSLLGPVDAFDAAAPGTFANGKRVSGWYSLDYAHTQVDRHGPGLVAFTVDPAKALAVPASQRATAVDEGRPDRYWAAARPLRDWLDEPEVPQDLEIHQNMPVRVKHVEIRGGLFGAHHLGMFAALVDGLVDDDRLASKALMHLLLVACEGDFDSPAFAAACACAWRDEPDRPSLLRDLVEMDPDKIVSAVLAQQQAQAPDAVALLREVLEATRTWSQDHDLEPGQGLLEQSGAVLDELERPR